MSIYKYWEEIIQESISKLLVNDCKTTDNDQEFKEKQIILTFDDGPDRIATIKILEVLEKHKIKAAFFINGTANSSDLSLVPKILEKGHVVGNHAWAHKHGGSAGHLSVNDFVKLHNYVKEKFGYKMVYYRVPGGGEKNQNTVKEKAKELGYCPHIYWKYDSRDHANKNADHEELYDLILKNGNSEKYPTVLFHDRRDKSTYKVLDKLIKKLKDNGWEILPFDAENKQPPYDKEKIQQLLKEKKNKDNKKPVETNEQQAPSIEFLDKEVPIRE